jgi:hypothetical protein
VSRKNSGTFVWQVFVENLSDVDAPSLPRSLVTLLLPKGSHPDVGPVEQRVTLPTLLWTRCFVRNWQKRKWLIGMLFN